MTAPARERRPSAKHIHLPSVHVRDHTGSGFDYEEDLFVTGRGRKRNVERIIRLVFIEREFPRLLCETFDVLCEKEAADLESLLPMLMQEGDPDVQAHMEERGRAEFARQIRIARGEETACFACGCSETRACSGGCLWATGSSGGKRWLTQNYLYLLWVNWTTFPLFPGVVQSVYLPVT